MMEDTTLALATPSEATGLMLSGVISGAIAGFSVYRREGWKQGATVGLLVFFAIGSIKMFVDIWKRPPAA